MSKYPHFFLTVLTVLSVLLPGCTADNTAREHTASGHYISIVMEADAEENGDAFTMESLRLIVFSPDGGCAGNELFGSGDYEGVLKHTGTGRGYWEIRLSVPMFVKAGKVNDRYDIYAVLNENGICSDIGGNVSLSGRLADKNLDRQTFLTLLDTALIYDSAQAGDGGKEPAFVMCAYKTGVYIPKSATPDNPYTVYLDESGKDGQPLDRTMAMVTVNHITGEEKAGNEKVSHILVLDVSLVNVPAKYVWNNDTGNNQPEMTAIPVPGEAAGTIDGDAFIYGREWDGWLTQTVTGSCEQFGAAPEHVRLYRVSGSGSISAWQLKTDPFDLTANTLYSYPTWNHKDKTQINPGNGPDFFRSLFSDPGSPLAGDGIIDWEYLDTDLTPGATSITGGDWRVNLNSGWYIPENIAGEKRYATCLKITLALGEPALDGFDFTEDIKWDTDDITVYINNDPETMPNLFAAGNKLEPFAAKYARACHADDPAIAHPYGYSASQGIVDGFDPSHGKFYYFFGDFSAMRHGSVTKTFTTNANLTGPGVTLTTESWRIIHGTETEFIIPINNNTDNRNGQSDDYSIYRNTKYSVTVKVNDAAYDILDSKSGSPAARRGAPSMPPVTLLVDAAEMDDKN